MKLKLQILLSLISGILVCISFPTLIAGVHLPEMGFVAWVALVPLILAIRGMSSRKTFLLTFLSASIWYGGSVFWVYRAMHTYGHLPPLTSFLVLILLIVVIASCISLAPMFARMIERRFRGEMIVWIPVCWVAAEILRNYAPCNGFPWSNIAMSQWRILPLIQIVDVVGVYGLIFLIVWVNVFLAELVAKMRGDKIVFLIPKAIVTAILLIATAAYGIWRMQSVESSLAGSDTLSLGIVQGNINQEEKWKKTSAADNLNVHREGTKRLLDGSVEMIIWPEASFPWPIEKGATEIDPRALGLEDGLGKIPYILLGVISDEANGDYYNSSILFDASGKIAGRYHKAHLVPFGEYVPYKKLLFFARKLTAPVGNFLAGESSEPLVAGQARPGILICYEDIFPEIARRETASGANFLANLTNDAWYGVSSAPFQHLAISVFRAVENRRFLVRATNSGVSAVVMPTGQITVESGIFETALIVSPVALLNNLTLYTRLGDWFAWGCFAYAAYGVIMAFVKKSSGSRRQEAGGRR